MINQTNILAWGDAASGTGILLDEHETNASRRYKALGSYWNYEHCGPRPKNPVHGTPWPPCHCLGLSYSSDGVHFDHPNNVSAFDPGNAPGLDNVGQDDGALDLAIYDADLGEYWGLVRIDAAEDGTDGHRRTGRFTTKDWTSFSAAEQVFHGSADYQIYTVQPFRLPQWPAGQYLATGMFFAAKEAQGV